MAIKKTDLRILACVDRSAYAEAVVDCAAWASAQIESPIEIMHVIDRHNEIGSGDDHSGAIGVNAQEALLVKLADADREKAIEAKAAGREFVQSLKSRLEVNGNLEVDTRLRHGSLLDCLPDYTDSLRVLVLGLKGESAQGGKQPIGKTFEAAVRSINKPILAVQNQFEKPRHFLFAFDGSAVSRRGVKTVVDSHLFKGMTGTLVMFGQPKGSGLGLLEKAAQDMTAGGVPTKAIHVDGEITSQLPNLISQQQAGLVVMGAYTHHPLLSLVRGSKTTELLQLIQVPALLLR